MTKLTGRHLPRLARSYYQGPATVHWIQTMAHRTVGWLHYELHQSFRELLLHTTARYRLLCPIYTLMPDHIHLIWMGTVSTSDQLVAMAFFRTYLKGLLKPYSLQRQAYDHVLKPSEREKGAFIKTCRYIQNNPVRAGYVKDWREWPYQGNILPGYPNANLLDADYWDRFWNVYHRLLTSTATREPSGSS